MLAIYAAVLSRLEKANKDPNDPHTWSIETVPAADMPTGKPMYNIVDSKGEAIDGYDRKSDALYYLRKWRNEYKKKHLAFTVNWNNDKGLGAVPNAEDAERVGMIAKMHVKEFLLAVLPKGEGINPVVQKAVDEGKPIGMPMLNIGFHDKRKRFEISGHEGRNRVEAVMRKGVHDVPVAIHLWQSARSALMFQGKDRDDIFGVEIWNERGTGMIRLERYKG